MENGSTNANTDVVNDEDSNQKDENRKSDKNFTESITRSSSNSYKYYINYDIGDGDHVRENRASSSHKIKHKHRDKSHDDKKSKSSTKEHKKKHRHRDKDSGKDRDKHRKDKDQLICSSGESCEIVQQCSRKEKEEITDKLESERRVPEDEMKQHIKHEKKYETDLVIADVKEDCDENNQNVSIASSSNYKPSKFETESDDNEDEEETLESEDNTENVSLIRRRKMKAESKLKEEEEAFESDDDFKPDKRSKKRKEMKDENETSIPKKRKKKEDEQEIWKWWEEDKKEDGVKWKFLEHNGPVFVPAYERLPESVKFYYDEKEVQLSEEAEEIAGFYAKMLDHDYTTKEIFNNNFLQDWRKVMTNEERSLITDLKKCNFKPMHVYFSYLAEKNRNRTKEEKIAIKTRNEEIQKQYGYCIIDGHKEKIGNYKIEPPGLFRGRGEHPKMGMLKKRILPEDVMINCSKDSKIPKPPAGHHWKEIRHDPTVTWLVSWTENVQNQVRYIMLNPGSKLKGEKDWQKYETARKLAKFIDKIREEYRVDWKSNEMKIRQRAVALYFIDHLALRAGNEKDEDQADTVGCCSLRLEHITLHEQKDGKDFVVVFDFLGKDSIRYYNEVPVEKRVFKNLKLFMENKSANDDLFDRLNTNILNRHLNELMEGLSAKVFRTYNASSTLQQQLDELTNADDTEAEKILSYNRANRAVAILCNHQKSISKGHAKSMERIKEKIEEKKEAITEMQRRVKDVQRDARHGIVKAKIEYVKRKKALDKLKEQLCKLEVQETDRDENKSIALGTSKLNYLDPRISVAWCKKYGVSIEKIYNKTQRDKFRWAIDMAGSDYRF